MSAVDKKPDIKKDSIDVKSELAKEVKAPEKADGVIDIDVLNQIRDMDEEEEDENEGDGDVDHSFSQGIVWGYFEQAEQTFQDMAGALEKEDLPKLSSLGHFLKGSSAALGVIKVQESCERIQHYGNLMDEESGETLSESEALKRITKEIKGCIEAYRLGKAYLKGLYEE